MMNPDEDLSEAVVMVASRVRAILDELGRVEVDWSKHSLASGGAEARNVMAGRHPELSEKALAALDWTFTFEWR